MGQCPASRWERYGCAGRSCADGECSSTRSAGNFAAIAMPCGERPSALPSPDCSTADPLHSRPCVVRLFFAALPDMETRRHIASVARALDLAPPSSIVPDENFHMTLAFVGEQSE